MSAYPLRTVKRGFVCAFLVFVSWGFSVHDAAATRISVRLSNGMCVHKNVVSLKEARFKGIVRQKYDLSCGAASLATILRYFYNEDVREREVIEHALKHGDKEKIAKRGFSLLDLQNYAKARNYKAAGFKGVAVEKLAKLKVPTIVLLKSAKYSHFVVLKGVKRGTVYIADPAFGNRSLSLEEFAKNWNSIIFAVVSKTNKNTSDLVLESTLPAPEMNLLRAHQLGIGGYTSLRTPGEF